jgi:hypothetical protein
MEIVAAIAVPLFVFILPILLVLSYVAPGLFGRDEIWALQGPCLLLLPLSTSLWWIAIRRIVFRRAGGLSDCHRHRGAGFLEIAMSYSSDSLEKSN